MEPIHDSNRRIIISNTWLLTQYSFVEHGIVVAVFVLFFVESQGYYRVLYSENEELFMRNMEKSWYPSSVKVFLDKLINMHAKPRFSFDMNSLELTFFQALNDILDS